MHPDRCACCNQVIAALHRTAYNAAGLQVSVGSACYRQIGRAEKIGRQTFRGGRLWFRLDFVPGYKP